MRGARCSDCWWGWGDGLAGNTIGAGASSNYGTRDGFNLTGNGRGGRANQNYETRTGNGTTRQAWRKQ